MKFKFNLKNKEASIEADVEKLIDKNMDIKSNKPPKKTKYQIRQEEERKNKELEHKYKMRKIIIFVASIVFIIVFILIMGYISVQ